MSFCIIYSISNKINNKIYIGQTWTSLKERWHGGTGYKSCVHLNNAIIKYGKDNFYYKVITICHTQEIADFWENYFILKYNSENKKYGYNIKKGGSRGKHSAETIEKIKINTKNAMKNVKWSNEALEARAAVGKMWKGKKRGPHTDEWKENLSIMNSGDKNPFFGKKHTEETKLLLSKKAKGQNCGENNPMYGHAHSEETKNKMSKSKLGKTWKIINGKRIWMDKIK